MSLPTPRVLVLVLAHERDPWRGIEVEGQRETWVASPHPDAKVLFYYGRLRGADRFLMRALPGPLRRMGLPRLRAELLRRLSRRTIGLPVSLRGDRLMTPVPETPFTVGAKTLSAVRHCLDAECFDFVFRTNTSSYVNLEQLVRLVGTLPDKRLYAGVVITPTTGDPFVSGAGILLSRDAAAALVGDAGFEYELPDDVAVARSLIRSGFAMTELPRVDVRSVRQVDALADEVLGACHHYRCKVPGARSRDVELMRRLDARIRVLRADAPASGTSAQTAPRRPGRA